MVNIKQFIKAIDLFGHPVQFTFNQRPVQRSFFGGINTLILLGLFMGIAFQGLINVLMKSQITSYTNDIYSTQPPPIDISPDKMNWAVTFTPDTLNIWQGYGMFFRLEVFQGIYVRDKNGTIVKTRRPVVLEPCKLDNFNENSQTVLLGMGKNVSNYLCPNFKDKFMIEGKFSSQNFTFLNFRLSKCKNTSNVTCASTDDIDKVFSNSGGKVYLNILFTNNLLNIYDFSSTLSSFLDDRTYLLINRNFYKEKNFYFTQQKIFTDDSILTTDYKEDINTFVYENNFDETELPLNANDDLYCSIYFRSNFMAKYHYRTFEKIGRFISYIGGYWSLLFLLFSLVCKRYNRHRFLVKMSNELYDFEVIRSQDETNNLKNNSKALALIPFRAKDGSNIRKFVEKPWAGGQSEYSKFHYFLQSYLDAKNKIKLKSGIGYFLVSLFKSKENEKVRHQNILKYRAFNEIYKDLDIIHLLKKLKQIDKIKALLLNETQASLFDFNHKTKIDEVLNMRHSSRAFLEKMHSRRKNIKRNLYEQGFKDLKDYYQNYLILQKDPSEKNQPFNAKIISFVSKDLISIFQNMSENSSKMENFPIYCAKESISLPNYKADSAGVKSTEKRLTVQKPLFTKKNVS